MLLAIDVVIRARAATANSARRCHSRLQPVIGHKLPTLPIANRMDFQLDERLRAHGDARATDSRAVKRTAEEVTLISRLRSRAPRWTLLVGAVALTVVAVADGIGFLIFSRAASDPLTRADAVVVLAGEHDGREDYGVELARAGIAPVVVLSDPYKTDDPVMRRLCAGAPGIETICERPPSFTTRGEASMARRLADERQWKRVMVVTWRFHLYRARMIFSQCFSSSPGAVMMRDVPRSYSYDLAQWQQIYLYQYGALAKATAQGPCI